MLNMLAASNSSNPKSSMFLSALEAPCKDASELFQRASQPAHALAPKAHQEHALDGTRMRFLPRLTKSRPVQIKKGKQNKNKRHLLPCLQSQPCRKFPPRTPATVQMSKESVTLKLLFCFKHACSKKKTWQGKKLGMHPGVVSEKANLKDCL
jgi:hypothetical protein